MTSDLIFDVQNVTLRFGGVTSLSSVTLQHRRGEILAVIGPNGAGKTSLFNSLTGVYQPKEGTITFNSASRCQSVQSTSATFLPNGVRLAGQEAPGRTRRQGLHLLDAVRGHDVLPVGPRRFATRDLQRVGLQ